MASQIPSNLLKDVFKGDYYGFRSYINENKITDLDLSGKVVGEYGLNRLGAALITTNITKVNLSNNQIGDDDAKAFAKSLETTKVTTLDLSNNKISQNGAIGCVQHLKFYKDNQVATIDFNGNPISARGAKSLREQAENTRINIKLIPQAAALTKRKEKPANASFLPQFKAQAQLVKATKPSTVDDDAAQNTCNTEKESKVTVSP